MNLNFILDKLVINKKGEVAFKTDNKGTVIPYPMYTDPITKRKYLKIGNEIIYHDLLVAKIFIPNPDPDNYTKIEHIDGNIENDSIENLRWAKEK